MAQRTVVGVFGSVADAERAKAHLARAGVAPQRIALSRNLMDDGIAAEAPGQSFEHQSQGGSDSADIDWARYNSAVRSGACLLSVSSDSGADRRQLAGLLRREGARITLERPG